MVENAEGALGIDAQFFKLYSPKVDVTTRFLYFPNFSIWGRQRIEFDGTIRVEVLKDIFVNFSLYDSYDSNPPAVRATGNDYGFTSGVSWSFRRQAVCLPDPSAGRAGQRDSKPTNIRGRRLRRSDTWSNVPPPARHWRMPRPVRSRRYL